MTKNMEKNNFEEIYNKTYTRMLKFAVVKCNNIDDVNDIIQDTYIELLKIMKKKKVIPTENLENYVLGIANNVIKRHYSKKRKDKVIIYYPNKENDEDIEIKDEFDIEQDFIKKENVEIVWEYLKNKDLKTMKIFYLYFVFGMQLKEISKTLEMTESNIKNKIYRTLKELKNYLGKEVV